MYMDTFYPPGREKIHAQGAIDMALWDIKGKALQLPVYDLLHGTTRNHVECYATDVSAGRFRAPWRRARRRAACGLGRRVAIVRARPWRQAFAASAWTRRRRRDSRRHLQYPRACTPRGGGCKEIREGVGNGDWMIDFHQKFDFADALRCCRLIEDYEPCLVEDPVRDEHALEEIPKLRPMTTCPLAHGEEWGQR